MTTKQKEEQKQVVQQEVIQQGVETNQALKEVDSFWDGWFNSFKTFQTYQSDLETGTLKVFENQKELINNTHETLVGMEKETTKLAVEWKENFKKTIPITKTVMDNPFVSNWMNQVEAFNDKVQKLSWTPGKVMLDLFSQSQVQLETNIKSALDQQQNNRNDALKAIGQLTEQMKTTQKSFLDNNLITNLMTNLANK